MKQFLAYMLQKEKSLDKEQCVVFCILCNKKGKLHCIFDP